MANHLNELFTSIASKTVQNVNPSSKSATCLIPQNPDLFSFSNSPLTKLEILEATKLLKDKKTPDFCGISTNFLKQTISSFIDPLFHIFKLSFSCGVVPVQFKIAKVIPIFKSGDSSSMDNYRRISLLSSFSKMLEKIVASRLTSFFESSNLLSKWQFGFCSEHSTSHPMVHFLNKITESLNVKNTRFRFFATSRKHSIPATMIFYFLNSKNTELKTQSFFGLNLT